MSPLSMVNRISYCVYRMLYCAIRITHDASQIFIHYSRFSPGIIVE